MGGYKKKNFLKRLTQCWFIKEFQFTNLWVEVIRFMFGKKTFFSTTSWKHMFPLGCFQKINFLLVVGLKMFTAFN